MTLDEATRARIAAVDPVHADTMGRQRTTVATEQPPFFKRFRVLTVTVLLPHRPLLFRYADDGTHAVYLSGAPEDVYKVDDEEGLSLAESQVAPYLRLFLSVTRAQGRELVESPAQVAWLPTSESDPALKAARSTASERIRALQVRADTGGFRAVGTALQGRQLVRIQLRVTANGRVSVDPAEVLQQELPIAATL